ncbi:GNAT family N-acetyltransferase [Roseibium sp. HPY-6]|uniref:GNAT family N-acetyltransferase n=1 Tax=Roseibium sp. HPY-6 TaxID=3229852 RepID=UPI00338DDF43
MQSSPLSSLQVMSWSRKDGYTLSTDQDRIDLEVLADFLKNDAYWSNGLPEAVLKRALAGSLVMGVYTPDGRMVGFARLVTDCAVFAYLRDVFVLPMERGKGLAVWMARQIRDHPDLATISTWMLATKDAHQVYKKAGYRPVKHPEWYMTVPKHDL